MDVSRSIGTGIVMIIPSFVGGGAAWEFFNNWGAVFAWLAVMIVTYGFILYRGHYSKK
ncbi:MAG: hypothetical protein JW944_00850 [Deltaproteobacteria bacterium]|nr:hypothetical protein [Deltaproteobacteria bacterium]